MAMGLIGLEVRSTELEPDRFSSFLLPPGQA
jgi:hypothetical protein